MGCKADFINNGKWISLLGRLLFEKIKRSLHIHQLSNNIFV